MPVTKKKKKKNTYNTYTCHSPRLEYNNVKTHSGNNKSGITKRNQKDQSSFSLTTRHVQINAWMKNIRRTVMALTNISAVFGLFMNINDWSFHSPKSVLHSWILGGNSHRIFLDPWGETFVLSKYVEMKARGRGQVRANLLNWLLKSTKKLLPRPSISTC